MCLVIAVHILFLLQHASEIYCSNSIIQLCSPVLSGVRSLVFFSLSDTIHNCKMGIYRLYFSGVVGRRMLNHLLHYRIVDYLSKEYPINSSNHPRFLHFKMFKFSYLSPVIVESLIHLQECAQRRWMKWLFCNVFSYHSVMPDDESWICPICMLTV